MTTSQKILRTHVDRLLAAGEPAIVEERPAYREPWSHGAKAYPEADTLLALWDGVKRKRKPLTVHVAHTALTGIPCAGCGHPLDGPYPVNPGEPATHRDELGYAYVDVNPRAHTAVARHYYCAWGAVMADVMKLRPPGC